MNELDRLAPLAPRPGHPWRARLDAHAAARGSARLRSLDPDLPGMVMAIRAGLIAGLVAAVILCVVSGKGIWPILISWAGSPA